MKLSDLLPMVPPALLALMSLVEVSPIKFNPWSALAKWLGRAINAEVMAKIDQIQTEQTAQAKKIDEIKAEQAAQGEKLDSHIRKNETDYADSLRATILRFNSELLLGRQHTQEGFIEILRIVDEYEAFCRAHPNYPNNRSVFAVQNIKRVYAERLQKRDFLGETPAEVHE